MMDKMKYILLKGMVLWLFMGCQPSQQNVDWPDYLGNGSRQQYSSLAEINVENVHRLEKAWTFHTLDTGEMQCNPIIVKGVLYGQTATKQVFALKADTGEEIWRFVPDEPKNIQRGRGVSYWSDGAEERILTTNQSFLYALDARTGQPIPDFGKEGKVNLKAHLGPEGQDHYVVSRTPGTIFQNSIILPLTMKESAGGIPGYIQAINVLDGSIQWTFQTIPAPGEWGSDTWPAEVWEAGIVGGANSWAGMAIDRERGILFVPTGSASPDFFGGNRKGQNLFANCLIALDVHTGQRLWHYQFVHHDLWDRDLPAPPTLTTIRKQGKTIDVVTQTTKTGHVYVFDRETGSSLYPIKTFDVPASPIAEEEAWPVQRYPEEPLPFSRQTFSIEDINPYSKYQDSLKRVYQGAAKGHFMPLSDQPTILFPGCDGGAEWGGTAVDPDGVLYVNSNEMAWIFTLSKSEQKQIKMSLGQFTYQQNCASCHQNNLAGIPDSGYPALNQIKNRFSKEDLTTIIHQGRGRMPGFPQLSDKEKGALTQFLFGETEEEMVEVSKAMHNPLVPYVFDGYKKFLDPSGDPAIAPPWGQLTAIDLNTGSHLWQVPLGEDPKLKARGIPNSGTENYGGPIVTAGGLLFIAATKDGQFRAFDRATGALLWETTLPAAGFATPSTYEVDGRQYLVIACGGTKLGLPGGDAYVAFALPE